jgi:S1-C subfamily serine protease
MGIVKAFIYSLIALSFSCAAIPHKIDNFKYGAEDDAGFDSPNDEIMYKSAVFIETTCAKNSWYGSGTAIGKREIATAKHVVTCSDGSLATDIKITNYKKQIIRVTVLASSKLTDAVILQTKEDQFVVHAKVAVGKLKIGASLLMFSGMNKMFKPGKIGRVRKNGTAEVNFSPRVFPGDSGSGVFNTSGELVGVIYGWSHYSNDDTTSIITTTLCFADLWPPSVLKENNIIK